MDGTPAPAGGWGISPRSARRWLAHARHDVAARPHPPSVGESTARAKAGTMAKSSTGMITLDGSEGEGGGQILRTALSLSMITGRPFKIRRIRANRDKPGLRPQHLAAVEASALLCGAEVSGGAVGSRELTFRPGPIRARDLEFAIGTAGASALVLQTLHLPIALRGDRGVRVAVTGGTFNTKAPSYPFLADCWRGHLAAIGLPIALSMPSAGFYPRGGGRIEAWIEPATPAPVTLADRGPLRSIRGVAGACKLERHHVAERMRDHARSLLADRGWDLQIEVADWPGLAPGAALSLTAEHAHVASTFVGLGERGKPAEVVAEEAVAELIAYEDAIGAGAVDPHSADQILLPLALAKGRSEYTVTEVTEHLRTNSATIRAFLDREIRIDSPDDGPGRVVVLGSGTAEGR